MLAKLSTVSLFAALTVWIDTITGKDFISHIGRGDLIFILATMLALNVATTTFLLGQMTIVESQFQNQIFDKSRAALRKSSVAMFVTLLVAIATQFLYQQQWQIKTLSLNTVYSFLCMAVLFSAILITYELLNSAITFSSKISEINRRG